MADLGDKVLKAIEQRRLAPKPYGQFLAKRSVFWLLAGASIGLGSICVALAIFAVYDLVRTGGRNFSDMPFDEVFESLPFAWLILFILFIASAYFALSRTRRGYLYQPMTIIAMAVAASVGLGILLHVVDAGRVIHGALAARFPAYGRATYVPHAEWSRPDEGYLGGEVLSVKDGVSLRLKAFDGREWEVDISGAVINVADPLIEEGDIAVQGERTGPMEFTARTIDEFD